MCFSPYQAISSRPTLSGASPHKFQSFENLPCSNEVSMNKRKVEMNVVDIIFVFVSEGCFAKWIPNNSGKKNRTAGCVLNVPVPGPKPGSTIKTLRGSHPSELPSCVPAWHMTSFSPKGDRVFWEAGKRQVSGPPSDTKPSQHFPSVKWTAGFLAAS